MVTLTFEILSVCVAFQTKHDGTSIVIQLHWCWYIHIYSYTNNHILIRLPWWQLEKVIEAKEDHDKSNGQAAEDNVGAPIHPAEKLLCFSKKKLATTKPTKTTTKKITKTIKTTKTTDIMSLAWQWPGVRGSCQGLSQPGTSPAGWRWRAQPGTKESLISDIFVAPHLPLARPAGSYQSRRWRPCPRRRARRISQTEYWQVVGKTWAENESVRRDGRRSKRLWKMMEKKIEKKMGEYGRGVRRCYGIWWKKRWHTMEEEIEDAMVYDGKENGRRWKIRRKIMEEEIGGDLLLSKFFRDGWETTGPTRNSSSCLKIS